MPTYLYDPVTQPEDDDVLHPQIPLHKHHSRSQFAVLPEIVLSAVKPLLDVLFEVLQQEELVEELGRRRVEPVIEAIELARSRVGHEVVKMSAMSDEPILRFQVSSQAI